MRRPSAVRTGMFCRLGSLAGQPPGDRHRLRVVGVHAPGARVHHQRQLVGVGGFELGQAAIFEQQLRQRIIERQFLQHFFVGGRRAARRFFLHRQSMLVEQDFLHLLGRVEVERLPGRLVGLRFELAAFSRPARGSADRAAAVSSSTPLRSIVNSTSMHRHFDVAVDRSPVCCPARSAGTASGASCSVMSASSAAYSVARVEIDLVEADLLCALARDFVVGDGLDAEMAQREVVHVVRLVAFQHVGLQQRVVRRCRAEQMPWLANICWSYLRFCPSFLCCALSSQGLSLCSTCSRLSCSGAPG